MLVSLGAKKPADDVAGMLRDCHDRIRRFTALAGRLAAPGDAPAAEVAEAAGRVLHYFEKGLPLHAEDEDLSLRPRLLGTNPELADALAAMTAEHREIDEAIAIGVPAWRVLTTEPTRAGELSAVLAEAASRLDRLFAIHLPPEEERIFPAVARLPAEVQAEIREEMRARRSGEKVAAGGRAAGPGETRDRFEARAGSGRAAVLAGMAMEPRGCDIGALPAGAPDLPTRRIVP
jgi:hypothetical protein